MRISDWSSDVCSSDLFAHLPMILDKEGKKLSKRTNSVSVMEYRADGFLPHAILNYLVRLGWSHGDQEIFSRAEMIALFDIADVNKAASRFDTETLAWLNQHYLKTDDRSEEHTSELQSLMRNSS